MSISIKRYVDVTSGVGGAAVVARRSLGMRLFTPNAAIPAGSVVSVTQLSDVQALFGQSSNEFKAASNYFGFISKTINQPQQMSFVRVTADATVQAAVYGAPIANPATLNLPAGAMKAVFGSVEINIAFPVVGSTLAVQAAALQTALRALPAQSGFQPFLNCVVTPNTNYSSLVVTLSVAEEEVAGGSTFYFTAETGGTAATDAATALGLDRSVATSQVAVPTADPAIDEGVVYSSQISDSTDEDDNYATFAVVPPAGQFVSQLTVAQAIAIAAWNHAQNNKFIFLLGVTPANYADIHAQGAGYSGFALTLVLPTTPANDLDVFPELAPGAVLGASDYTNPAASQNFMFYQFASYTPTVTTDADADKYDAARVNYIGRTQSAGQKVAFYQRGSLQGLASAAVDMTTYSGEIWLKDAIVSTCLNGLLAVPSLSANRDGRATVLAWIQGPIDEALENGVISVGKTLTNIQQSYITQITGNSSAWRQIEEKGYWIDASVKSDVDSSGATEYYIEYLLVYGKNDQIRKIVGRDIMI